MQLKYAIILFLVASVQACSTKVEKEVNSVAKACEKPSKDIGLTDSSASEAMSDEWKRLYRIFLGFTFYGVFLESPELADKTDLSAKTHQDKCGLAKDAVENNGYSFKR